MSQHSRHSDHSNDIDPSDVSAAAPKQAAHRMRLAPIVDAQVAFIIQWLTSEQRQQTVITQFWQWLGQQPLSRYISDRQITDILCNWWLRQPLTQAMRSDIRCILQTLIYHPINDKTPFSELIEDAQISALAHHIASHQNQRRTLIHSLIGNETFANLLTQTLHHAIDDFMESTLDKAGGVGKLMKFGRSSFEKATNNNLDDKLQSYLHRNIKDLTHRAEINANEHLNNAEVARLIELSWAQIKSKPISSVQHYLNDGDDSNGLNDPNNDSNDSDNTIDNLNNSATGLTTATTVAHLEAGLHANYDRLRQSDYMTTLITASVHTWYDLHADEPIQGIAASLNIDEHAMGLLAHTLRPLLEDLSHSSWLTEEITELLYAFYEQPDIQRHLTGYQSS